MGTAYGQVIDYLFSGTVTVASSPLFGQALKPQLATVDENVVLADNLYTSQGPIDSDSVVTIGRESLDVATSTDTRVYLTLGAYKIEEAFDIPILIMVRGNGPAQKPVRDRALGLFNAIAHFVQQDLTLGGVLLDGRSGMISDYQITQTETEDDEAGGAMQAVEIAVTLHCRNHYTP
jgi:hypothetical protein